MYHLQEINATLSESAKLFSQQYPLAEIFEPVYLGLIIDVALRFVSGCQIESCLFVEHFTIVTWKDNF